MKTKLVTIIILMAALSLLTAPRLTRAQACTDSSDCETTQQCCHNKCITKKAVCLNVPIGNTGNFIPIEKNPLGTYVRIWYGFIIGSVGIMATIMIMWGGFKWLTSRGNQSVIGEAKEIIWSALIGLFLAFLSYTILNLINPELLNITMPAMNGLPGIEKTPTDLTAKKEAEASIKKDAIFSKMKYVDPEFIYFGNDVAGATRLAIVNFITQDTSGTYKQTRENIAHGIEIYKPGKRSNSYYLTYNTSNVNYIKALRKNLEKQGLNVSPGPGYFIIK